MRYITARASRLLEDMFSLPARGDEQDWDIELANSDRVGEFLSRLHETRHDDDLYFALMCLIVASFDRSITGVLRDSDLDYWEAFRQVDFDIDRAYTKEDLRVWNRISAEMKTRMDVCAQIVDYWRVRDDNGEKDDEESGFACTPLFRHDFPE